MIGWKIISARECKLYTVKVKQRSDCAFKTVNYFGSERTSVERENELGAHHSGPSRKQSASEVIDYSKKHFSGWQVADESD